MSTRERDARELPDTRDEASSHREAVPGPSGFFRALPVALPLGLLLWAAILAAAWWLWRG